VVVSGEFFVNKVSFCGVEVGFLTLVYKLTCPYCNKAYVGQMGQSFTQRFKEHRNAFKSSRNTSNCAKHALEHLHPFGPIHETMQCNTKCKVWLEDEVNGSKHVVIYCQDLIAILINSCVDGCWLICDNVYVL